MSATAPSPPNALLARYVAALERDPLGTKQLTSGVLSALAEVLAGHFAGLPPSTDQALPPGQVDERKAAQQQPLRFGGALLKTLGINERAVKMFIYGWAVSAPLGHVLVGALQKAFAGRTTPKDRVLQIIVSQLTVTVISNVVYLSSMAIVNGARSVSAIQGVLKAGLWRMLQISWVTSPVAIAFAQRFLEPQLWEPAFTVMRFFLATYFNTMAKRKQVALAKAEAKKRSDDRARKETGDAEIRNKAASEAKR